MNPLFWLGAGLLTMFFSSKKAMAAASHPGGLGPGPGLDSPPPAPPPIKAGLDEPVISTPIPAGWRRLQTAEVTPELLGFARSALGSIGSEPYGTTTSFKSSTGGEYMAMVEQHYHTPGGPVKPWGLHHGITLLTRA